jgi:uncharacterized membrane protein
MNALEALVADPVSLSQTAAAAAETVADPINWTLLLLTLTRWVHYVAGVLWIGHLYFFNFVNVNLQGDAKYPADFKKVVNPLLMTRALFMFRWGAMFTFLSGLIMLGLLWNVPARWTATMQGGYMAMGAIFGIVMWFNVWFVIWPRQKKIIGAAQGGPAVDPAVPKQAAMASKINTYLSVPLLLGMMCGGHSEYMLPGGAVGLLVGLLVGLSVVWLGYKFAPKVDTQIFKG